ncbi:hypothetical protein M0813_16069 [Anaeramoeba flamelloides]|uniref:Uncharacterized protein n=1 Tax=Anaeramoeba flamelloides TaxID=1746091 RepID=A0ABQ8Z0T4_9EUKA|nr:hypothetical protein M0813_16069 [Anaeramoeba flamelloides]
MKNSTVAGKKFISKEKKKKINKKEEKEEEEEESEEESEEEEEDINKYINKFNNLTTMKQQDWKLLFKIIKEKYEHPTTIIVKPGPQSHSADLYLIHTVKEKARKKETKKRPKKTKKKNRENSTRKKLSFCTNKKQLARKQTKDKKKANKQ